MVCKLSATPFINNIFLIHLIFRQATEFFLRPKGSYEFKSTKSSLLTITDIPSVVLGVAF